MLSAPASSFMACLSNLLPHLDGCPHGAIDGGPLPVPLGLTSSISNFTASASTIPTPTYSMLSFYRRRGSSLPRRLFFSDLRRPSSPPGSPRRYLFGERVQAPLPRRHSFHDVRETGILPYRDSCPHLCDCGRACREADPQHVWHYCQTCQDDLSLRSVSNLYY